MAFRNAALRVEGFFEGASLRDRLIGWSIIGGPLLLLVLSGVLFLRAEPIERAAVLGCYTAAGAPSLEIKPDQIEIVETGRRTFDYLVEPDKQGYRLSVRPALGLAPDGNGQYVFQADRGIGYFWSLLTKASDSPKKLRHPRDFGGRFEVVASDGVVIIYTRSSHQSAC